MRNRCSKRMVINFKKHYATEKRDLAYCILTYNEQKKLAKKLVSWINQLISLDFNSKILEIGAAQGRFMIALSKLGYFCEGIEPYKDAIIISKEFSKKLKTEINITRSVAENIPFDNNSFDVVFALSVIEHVKNVEDVFTEIFRILKPKGVFFFSTASSLCPYQGEIRFFPFFSWYPEKIKLQIMVWAVENKPSLVGYTDTPAINWFTPWKANRLLMNAGFEKIYDRWDIIRKDELSIPKKNILKIIKKRRITKLLADIIVPGCAYLAVKGE